MTAPSIPSQKDCLRPVMKAMHSLGGEASNEEIYNFVIKKLELTAEQLSVPARKRQGDKQSKVDFNINFAKSVLKNAGYLYQPRRKLWSLTDAGIAAKDIDPNDVIKRSRIAVKERKLREGKSALDEKASASADGAETDYLATNSGDSKENEPGTESSITHDEVQWLLLSLGNEMKLDLWVARNDRGKSFQGNAFSELPRLRSNLPVQFDQTTQRIVELIDVLWLKGNSIIAAFEIEHTTSIYSGILRMSDLMALQPNLNINLYIVAPDKRRSKVKSEINRPTFGKTRLPNLCRYIAYSGLTQLFETQGDYLSYLNPAVLDKIAEDMKI